MLMKGVSLCCCLLILGVIHTAESSCTSCHSERIQNDIAHQAVACVLCHFGDATQKEKKAAHQDMEAVPGNMDTVARSCGLCHADEVNNVQHSLMNDARGIVSVERWVFGEQKDLCSHDGLDALGDSPADTHMKQLCWNCHLSKRKEKPEPVHELSRGGGCAACHAGYAAADQRGQVHPSVTADVRDDHCFGCHARSGRISLQYSGWQECLSPQNKTSETRVLEDGRVCQQQQADVHHGLGMSCSDCHDSEDVMGNGERVDHQEEQVHISCQDCHLPNDKQTASVNDFEASPLFVLIRRLRYENAQTFDFARKQETGRPLGNVMRKKDGDSAWMMRSKNTGKMHTLSAPSSACTQLGHERVRCIACHSTWTTQCIGCHTEQKGGRWQELRADYLADPPVLGVFHNQITCFAPGMIMSLKKENEDLTRHRLYAPVVPHTIQKEARSCESCHQSSLAIGAGRGTLSWTGAGLPQFRSEYALADDGLPLDAWCSFPGDERRAGGSTREHAFPLSEGDQRRIVQVGRCLLCHHKKDVIYDDFQESLKHIRPNCIKASPSVLRQESRK